MSNKDVQVRKTGFILFFVLIFILTLLTISKKGYLLPFLTKNPPVSIDTKVVELPFPLNKPYLGMVIIVYNFSGPVKEVKQTPEGTQIYLDLPDDNLPDFVLSDQYTQVFKSDANNKPVSASIAELKQGVNANVQIIYDLKLNFWRVIRVDIFN